MNNKVLLQILLAIALQFSLGLAHAGIISTNVSTTATIKNQDGITATNSNSGSLSASASAVDLSFDGRVDTQLDILSLTAQSASLEFDIMWDGGTNSSGSMRAPGFFDIAYAAATDTELTIDWDFGYTGDNAFGLQVIQLSSEGGSIIQNLGNIGRTGTSFTDSLVLSFLTGESSTYRVEFISNVSGPIGNVAGQLAGNINYNFVPDSPSTVPEPIIFYLLVAGLLGLGFSQRRRFERTPG